MKRLICLFITLLLVFTIVSCKAKEKEDITILYTNDIHGYIANTVKDSDSNELPGLRLDSIAGYKKKLISEKKNVLLVDAGDEVQGSVYGALDKGNEMIGIMNKAGYDLATPGNHDYYIRPKEDIKYISNKWFIDWAATPKTNTINDKKLDPSNYWFIYNKVLFINIDSTQNDSSNWNWIVAHSYGELYTIKRSSQVAHGKEFVCQCRRHRRRGSDDP